MYRSADLGKVLGAVGEWTLLETEPSFAYHESCRNPARLHRADTRHRRSDHHNVETLYRVLSQDQTSPNDSRMYTSVIV